MHLLLNLLSNAPIHLEIIVIIVSVLQHLGMGERNFSDPLLCAELLFVMYEYSGATALPI